MNFIENNFKVLRLADAFYDAYPSGQYVEILKKRERPYHCIIFEIDYGCHMCIPYRTQINHPYAYYFKDSIRSILHKSGLDYTKMVIIKNNIYLDKIPAIVDNDEYIETISNKERIKKNLNEGINFAH